MESIRFRRGFSLIELMVVLTIIIIITMVALTSQSSFNKTLILANTAYDIALTLRSTESLGIGSRALPGVANAGYGLHFDATLPGSFTLFADTSPLLPDPTCTRPDCSPGDHKYTPGADTLVQTYKLGNGITVSDFCANPVVGVWSCTINLLDIIFARPNPDPFMSVNGTYSAAFPITKACLTVTSPQGGLRYVAVTISGAITVSATSCLL